MTDELFLLGRVLFSLVFLRYGVLHLTQTEGSVQYAEYKKVPQAKAAVILSPCFEHETLGIEWMTPDLFRFGASSLLNDVLLQLRKQRTGIYRSPDEFTLD